MYFISIKIVNEWNVIYSALGSKLSNVINLDGLLQKQVIFRSILKERLKLEIVW